MANSLHKKHSSCRLCNSSLLQCVVPLQPIPLGEHYSSDPIRESPRFPIDLYQCLDCGAVQTQDDISPEYLWHDYTYFSGQTQKIIDHFSSFTVSILDKYFENQSPSVLDIGSNDGSLLKQFQSRGCVVQGIDPADTVVKEATSNGIPTVLGLFNTSTANSALQSRQFSLITAFNVFAHSHEMDEMATAVTQLLAPDGLFCFEVQYLPDIISKHILGTIFHEHMIHYSYFSASNFMSSYGLTIVDAWRNNIQNGSIIFIAAHSSCEARVSLSDSERLFQLSQLEQTLKLNSAEWASSFSATIRSTRLKVLELIKSTGPVAAFGAARSGPTLAIQYGLDQNISCLLDDHPSKCHKYSPFNELSVFPTSHLNAASMPYCVMLAYIHYIPILKSHRKYLADGGIFILLWPEYKLVSIENVDSIING